MFKSIIDGPGTPILGKESRAEQLVDWSLRSPVGKRWLRDFDFGLRLGFVAAKEEPKVYLHWNQVRFSHFLNKLTVVPEEFAISSYGVTVEYRHGETEVNLLGVPGGQKLWDTAENGFSRFKAGEDVNWLVGMIRFSLEGPKFLPVAACQKELEEATAIAIIRVDKGVATPQKVSPAKKLPPQGLSVESRAFLLNDILSTLVLKNKQGRGELG